MLNFYGMAVFQESNLPLSVDVSSYELTTYATLKAHMDKVRKPLFSQEDLRNYQGEAI